MSKNKDQGQEQTAQCYDIFLSYSRRDTPTAMLIKSAIQSLGYSVFYDQDILEGDPNWRATIARNIDNCGALVFFRTQNSVESKWCTREVNIADEADKNILPVAFLRDKEDLPSSPELQAVLLLPQTCFISESPTIADLKNELQTSLEKSIGKPQWKPNSLLLTDLMATATDNLNARYKVSFEGIETRGIESDVLNDRISFCLPFALGDEQAKLCIALNKFSKRPVCYANCKKKKTCPFFAEKDRKEYSLEAYLDFADHGRMSRIEPLLKKIFCESSPASPWCGNWGTKYFFRRRILEGFQDNDINEKNDLSAVLILLQEAVRFFDVYFKEATPEYFQFAYKIVSLFQEKDPASLIGEGWTLHDEKRSRVKLHFTRNAPSAPDRSELGILCSNAIDFPEALRIKLEAFEQNGKDDLRIWIRISRFDKNRKYESLIKFGVADPEGPLEKLKNEIKRVLELPAEKLRPVSQLSGDIHERLKQFIQDAPDTLLWDVSQDHTGCLLTAACWFPGCPEIRFVTGLEYHSNEKSFEWKQTVTSSFPGAAAESKTSALSEMTGFKDFHLKDIKNPEEIFNRTWSEETRRSLDQVHDKVSEKIYGPLKKLAEVSGRWKAWNAATVLLSDSRSNSRTEWNSSEGSSINSCRSGEECWEYYLAPGMRFCRRLRAKEFPVMFCVRFARAGAQNATIGWAADGDFRTLSVREKELFWYYVLSRFPPELRDRFGCKKNAVFLAREEDLTRDPRERQPQVFETVQNVQTQLEGWLSTDAPDSVCLMDRMFAVIEEAVNDFIQVNNDQR